jgi:hypothetical protein
MTGFRRPIAHRRLERAKNDEPTTTPTTPELLF